MSWHGYWTKDREDLLTNIYPSSTREEVLSSFPEKNWNALAGKAMRLQLHRKVPHVKHHPEIYPILTETQKQIIAWSIAWEGTISLFYQKYKKDNELIGCYYPIISIGNTNLELLKRFHDLTGYGRIGGGFKRGGNCKPINQWRIKSIYECKALLEQIISYLPSKREQGEILLKFLARRIEIWGLPYDSEDAELVKKIRILNKRGLN